MEKEVNGNWMFLGVALVVAAMSGIQASYMPGALFFGALAMFCFYKAYN